MWCAQNLGWESQDFIGNEKSSRRVKQFIVKVLDMGFRKRGEEN